MEVKRSLCLRSKRLFVKLDAFVLEAVVNVVLGGKTGQ